MGMWRKAGAGLLLGVVCGLAGCGGAPTPATVTKPEARGEQRYDLRRLVPDDAVLVVELDLARWRRSGHAAQGERMKEGIRRLLSAEFPSTSTMFERGAALLSRCKRYLFAMTPAKDGSLAPMVVLEGLDRAALEAWVTKLLPGRGIKETRDHGRLVLWVADVPLVRVASETWEMPPGLDAGRLWARIGSPVGPPSNSTFEELWSRLPSRAIATVVTEVTPEVQKVLHLGAIEGVDVQSMKGMGLAFDAPAAMDAQAVVLGLTAKAAAQLRQQLPLLVAAHRDDPFVEALGLDLVMSAADWSVQGRAVRARASLDPAEAGQWFFLVGRLPAMYRLVEGEPSEPAEPEVAEAEVAAGDVERFRVPVGTGRPVRGPSDALVTIVEFSDFQCPFCGRVEPTLRRIRETYGADVRIVWHNNPLPFHQSAKPAAMAAMEAYAQGGDAMFWKMHDLIFEHQQALADDDLVTYGKQVGMDETALRKALANGTHEALIKADQDLAERFAARGTPAFFINGRKLMGAQPFETFERYIDDELARARRLVSHGTARADVYAALTADGAERAEREPQPAARKRPDPAAVYKVPVHHEPSLGPAHALVTIVEIADFQCPFCDRVRKTLDQIRDKYGSKVRIVWMNNPLPFHPNAKPAAIAALEAYAQGGNRMFWRMHDQLFDHQRELDHDTLLELGKEAGMNVRRLEHALDTEAHTDVIEAQQQLAKELGATGTPSFFINGRNLRGAQPLEAFVQLIDEELEKAKKMVRHGTPRAKLYRTIIAHGATSPQLIE